MVVIEYLLCGIIMDAIERRGEQKTTKKQVVIRNNENQKNKVESPLEDVQLENQVTVENQDAEEILPPQEDYIEDAFVMDDKNKHTIL